MSKICGRGKSAVLKAPRPPLKAEPGHAIGLTSIKAIILKLGYLIRVSNFGERKRMWRICQFVLDLLFQDTDKTPFPWTKDTDLQRKVVEAYRLRTGAKISESVCLLASRVVVTQACRIPGCDLARYARSHDRRASDSTALGCGQLQA